MRIPKHIQELADQLGAEIEIDENNERSDHISITAPDGKVWVATDGITLVYVLYLFPKPTAQDKATMWEDFKARMLQGLEDETE